MGAARDKVGGEPIDPPIYIYICKDTTQKKRQIKQCGYITMCISHCVLLQSTALDQAKKLIKLAPPHPRGCNAVHTGSHCILMQFAALQKFTAHLHITAVHRSWPRFTDKKHSLQCNSNNYIMQKNLKKRLWEATRASGAAKNMDKKLKFFKINNLIRSNSYE